MTTRRPRALRRFPRLEAVIPLPSEDATPPVTKMCRVLEVSIASAMELQFTSQLRAFLPTT